MATKIITKNSSTASAAPLAADLSAGELAINTNDGKLFYKDSGGTVRTLASKDAAAGTFATLSASGNVTLSGGTANGVLYLNGSKVATSGSALTFDGTNFATTGTSSASKLIPTGGTATGNGLYLPAANTLGFSTNGTLAMTLDANSVLSVLNAVESTGAVQTNSANKIALSLESASTGRIAVFGADTSTFGTLVFSRAKSNGGTTESARIDSSGRLLVGTAIASGTNRLLVDAANSGSEVIRAQNTGGTGARIASWADGSATLGSGPNFYMQNVTGPNTWAASMQMGASSEIIFFQYPNSSWAERARIDSSGNLLVGQTTLTNAEKVGITFNGNTQTGLTINDSAGVSVNVQIFRNAGTAVGTISKTTTSTSYNTSSDYRLKENIQPMQNALGVVAQLNPVTYNWKADGSAGQGFIAHELAEVVPDCVTGEKDAVDADGNPIYQGIDTSFLVATLTAAIQELKAEVDNLKAQLNKGA